MGETLRSIEAQRAPGGRGDYIKPLPIKRLDPYRPLPTGILRSARTQAVGPALVAANWPRARSWATVAGVPGLAGAGRLAFFVALLATAAGPAGCGGAHAPCPTATTTLDVHREESVAAEREVRSAFFEERALKAKRDEAAARVRAAEAALDSLQKTAGKE